MDNKYVVAGLRFVFMFSTIAISAPLHDPPRNSIAVDSSSNQMSMWTQMHECLGYNPSIGGLGFVCRDFSTSGVLNVTETDSLFYFFLHDFNVYCQDYGGARYPSFTAGSDPYLFSPTTMNLVAGIYESGGWWTSSWDSPVDLGPTWVMVIGKQMDNGNIICIGVSGIGSLSYMTLTPDLGTVISSGVIANDCYYWGFDINSGAIYVFYYDDSLNVYHRSTADGMSWGPQQQDSIIWPQPYPNNIIRWMQMALTDEGNPILVFNVIDGDDPEWPAYGKIYVNVAPAETCIEISSAFGMPDTECTYCTIATGGMNNDKVVVIYCTPRNNLPDSLCFWDIFYNYSTDNGLTWNTPANITSGDPMNHCLPQLAKRLSSVAFYYAYGTKIANSGYDLLWDCETVMQAPPTRWYLGYIPVTGVNEYRTERPQEMALSVTPNPFRKNLAINFAIRSLIKSGTKFEMSLRIFDATGRMVKSFTRVSANPQGGNQPLNHITWDGTDEIGEKLPAGVYLVRLEAEGREKTEKVVLLR
jgi:hypothetical protein